MPDECDNKAWNVKIVMKIGFSIQNLIISSLLNIEIGNDETIYSWEMGQDY